MALTAEQKEIRRFRMGSSDIASAAGLHPYRRPIEPFMKFTGLADDFQGNWKTEKGEVMEPKIARWHAKALGAKEMVQGKTTVHPKEDWIVATPDYHLLFDHSPERLAEIKDVNRTTVKDWDQGVPEYVECQVHWQQEVTGIYFADVAASLVGEEPQAWQIDNSPEIRKSLVEIGRDFWFEHVLKNIPPEVEGTEQYATFLASTLKRHNSTMVRAPHDAEQWVEQRRLAKAAIKEAEARILEAKNNLAILTGENGGIYSDGWRAKWVDVKSNGTDWKALAEHLGATTPEINQFKRPGYKYLGVWEK